MSGATCSNPDPGHGGYEAHNSGSTEKGCRSLAWAKKCVDSRRKRDPKQPKFSQVHFFFLHTKPDVSLSLILCANFQACQHRIGHFQRAFSLVRVTFLRGQLVGILGNQFLVTVYSCQVFFGIQNVRKHGASWNLSAHGQGHSSSSVEEYSLPICELWGFSELFVYPCCNDWTYLVQVYWNQICDTFQGTEGLCLSYPSLQKIPYFICFDALQYWLKVLGSGQYLKNQQFLMFSCFLQNFNLAVSDMYLAYLMQKQRGPSPCAQRTCPCCQSTSGFPL